MIEWMKRGLNISSAVKVKTLKYEAPSKIANGTFRHLIIGSWSYIQPGSHGGIKLVIGRYCSIAENFVAGPPVHPTHFLSTSTCQYQRRQFGWWMPEDMPLVAKLVKPLRKAEVVVGNDVWIGRDVIVMRGVKIGDGAIVASGAIVTKDVPPYAVVAGVPAKVVKMRFDDNLVREMQAVAWWQYDRNELRGVPFDDPVAALDEIKRRALAGTLKPRPIEYQDYPGE